LGDKDFGDEDLTQRKDLEEEQWMQGNGKGHKKEKEIGNNGQEKYFGPCEHSCSW
jgi:hypothetical protein